MTSVDRAETVALAAPARAHAPAADLAVAGALAAAGAAIALWGFSELGSALERETSFNLWFDADTPRVIANLTDAASNHYRTSVHPLSSILLSPVVMGLAKLGMDPLSAARTLVAAAAGASPALYYAIVRKLGLPRAAGLLFALMFLSSAAFIHWSAVVELNLAAGLSILVALAALAWGRSIGTGAWAFASAASLSVTITNWSIGLIATFARWPLPATKKISIAALLAVAALSTIQMAAFTNARPFFSPFGLAEEKDWTHAPAAAGERSAESVARSLFVTTMVTPRPVVETHGPDRVITNQNQTFDASDWRGPAAAAGWLSLLALGVWGGARTAAARPVVAALSAMIAAQFALHLFYGDPTFLYASHFLPLLATLAALSWLSPLRWIAVALAIATAALGGDDNFTQFRSAAAFARQIVDGGGNPVQTDFRAKGALLPGSPLR